MMKRLAILAAGLVLAGCSKTPPVITGTGAIRIKDGVWATYGWSHNRMSYVIFFTTPPGFNSDGAPGVAKIAKEGDSFEGGLDGLAEKSKFPFKVDAKAGKMMIEGKSYGIANGVVFLVQPGQAAKTQQVVIPFIGGPKNPEEVPAHMDAQVKKLVGDHPKIKEFPAAPPPPPTKKK